MGSPTMRQHLITISEPARASASELAVHLTAHGAFAQRLRDLGVLADAGRLHPSADGVRVRARGVERGPFADAFDRYYQVRADDVDAAVALTADLPLGPGDVVDVRPLMKGDVQADKLDRPGKVFACSVLGAAPDEPSWDELMDRIDAATHGRFPTEHFAAGMRLEAPRAGRRITLDAGKRKLVDGPFLESKEVIGGLFFLRMPSIDDAIRWARDSQFAALATLELRELWRT